MLDYGPLVLGTVVATPFLLTVISSEVRRLLRYAALIPTGWALALLDFEVGISVTVVGAAISTLGAIVLIRFLRDNPPPDGSERGE